MKRFLITVSIAGALLAFGSGVAAEVSAEVALRAAIEKETVKGDLKGAIDQYKKLAQDKDRSVAAKALLRMGQCYEKLGDGEARIAYERVVREFGDQKEAVAQAEKLLAAKGRRETGLVARLITNVPDGGSYVGPLSRDGRYVAYTTKAGVFVHDLVTGEQRHLVSTKTPKEALFAARISPDGKRVAYERWPNAPGTPGYMCEIYVVGVDGSAPRHLAGDNDVRAELSTWSPDGTQLLAVRDKRPDDPSGERILIRVVDGSSRVIGSGRMREARFSPDGKQIAFTKRRGPRPATSAEGHGSDIFLVSSNGGDEVPLVENAGSASNPIWMPGGEKLLFVSNRRNGTNDMWSVRLERGKPAGSLEFVKERVDRIVDVTPQGECYYRAGIFSQDLRVQSNQIWVLTNLFRENKSAQ